jgi:hypothetical protein
MDKRKCESCTKCCEGHFIGEALGHSFSIGKPCHFVAIGKGCTVYAKRPQDPCASYKCSWLTNLDIPEWLKPEISNVIIDQREIDGHSYMMLKEAGATMSSKALNWFIQYVLNNQLNAIWQVEGGDNWMGSPEFVNAVLKRQTFLKANLSNL